MEGAAMQMQDIGFVGLGKMGGNMARRLRRSGVAVAGYNRQAQLATDLARETGLAAADSLDQMVQSLSLPRIVWLMVPAGDATQQTIDQLTNLLSPRDIVVDGGNSYYKDSMRRWEQFAKSGIRFVDAGVSGGIWGLENGYALMVGGEAETVAAIERFLKLLAPTPQSGWLHCGPVGSGHFAKMIHNGIEYGMMQALAEGLSLLRSRTDFGFDLAAVSEMWRHGSVVRSWLLDLTADFLKNDQKLESVAPFVPDSGEGRWTALEAVEQGVPAPVMSLALMTRFASQGSGDFAAQLLSMMRKGFGGHAVRPETE
ncbi:MAG: phosphogluconate dehydrogenase (NAD(+)-dependent, decarboxylating) [Acidiferrobacterales bacterium]